MLRAQSSNQCAKQEPRHGKTMVVARRRGDRTNQATSQGRPAVGSFTLLPAATLQPASSSPTESGTAPIGDSSQAVLGDFCPNKQKVACGGITSCCQTPGWSLCAESDQLWAHGGHTEIGWELSSENECEDLKNNYELKTLCVLTTTAPWGLWVSPLYREK